MQGKIWRRLLAAGLLVASGIAPAACGAGREKTGAAARADAEWTWLEQTKGRLDSARSERARAEASGAAAPQGDAASPAAPDPAPARPPRDPPMNPQIERLAAEFSRRLVEYINSHPPVQGEPLDERQRAALRMKSDEEMVQARAYIEQGGDYQRAIEIYEAALSVDPGNAALRRELASARALRYMTPERFARAKEGMSPREVRQLLGQPNLHNVREYADRGVTAWFYPKGASGAAAAIWFHREPGAAEPTVYMLDFNAVSTEQAPPEDQAGG
jgi:tetratricopeptide (TPR) repeat protein